VKAAYPAIVFDDKVSEKGWTRLSGIKAE